MIDAVGELIAAIGRKLDAASSTGTLHAKTKDIADNRVGANADAANASGSVSAKLAEMLTNRLSVTKSGYLDAAISTRLSSAIKTVQYGTVTVAAGTASGTATITAVTIGKSVLIMLGWTQNTATAPVAKDFPRITLTNSTTVTANSGASVAGSDIVTSFVVVECW